MFEINGVNKVIEVNRVSLTLSKKEILNNISLRLESGHIYGLVGNNGCGKTMLMRCICGFVKPTEGYVKADGKIIGKDVDYLPDAGIIIETPGFIPYYSGLKNLVVLAGIKNKITKEDMKKAMRQTGLDPESKMPVKKYSLEMRQRLGLAQAIMEQPSVLVLDEPMNGLDKHGVAEVRKLLLSLRTQDKLLLIASHSAEDISILCDQVYEMENGEIV
ncbi:MAG: ATP-binding cassette domain-containing protein [Clostridiales bacterium]|nr:ATP-binding cassette domain-containing protein [Clostridiales bacterium]